MTDDKVLLEHDVYHSVDKTDQIPQMQIEDRCLTPWFPEFRAVQKLFVAALVWLWLLWMSLTKLQSTSSGRP